MAATVGGTGLASPVNSLFAGATEVAPRPGRLQSSLQTIFIVGGRAFVLITLLTDWFNEKTDTTSKAAIWTNTWPGAHLV